MESFRPAILGLGLVLLASCEQKEKQHAPVVFTDEEIHELRKLSPLPAIPPSPTNAVADSPAAVKLGRHLFFDARLSANGSVSCATCHDPEKGFSDGKALSEGLATTDRHSQSLWNVAHQRWLFWDGRADSLWAQSLQPILDEREMGSSIEHVRKVVVNDQLLHSAYEDLFGKVGDHSLDRFFSNIGKSIEAYERKIISKGSAFDHFVSSIDEPAEISFSESARRGLRIFVGRGQCILCHSGPNFSDGEFHNIGLPRHPDLPRDSGRFVGIRKVQADRFNGTGEFSDDQGKEANVKLRYIVVKMNNLAEFKTPSLRNVAQTAPYMHDGRFKSLREVLNHYSKLPGDPPLGHREETLQPLDFSEQEMQDLEAFLKSLTGEALDESLKQIGKREER